MAKAKKAANAVIDLVTPNKPKTSPLSEAKEAFKSPQVQSDMIIDPQRMAFPGIYDDPSVIAAEAASRVAPESPNLKRLFGVSRDDLYQIGKDLRGNLPGTLPGAAANPKGSAAAEKIMTPKNVQRILDVNAEAEKFPELVRGMDPWYVMTPYYKRMVELLGPERAAFEYRIQNALMGMASPGSEVTTEIPRGSAAYFLHKQGRFPEFMEFMGMPAAQREAAGVPKDIIGVPGHMYHKTAQALPMDKFLKTGELEMTSPKVPMYIEASGVPEIGFQTQTPVGDAHWSRAVGLGDTRTAKNFGASVSNPEMTQLAPWWRDAIAKQLGIESVPAQARTWGAFSGQTGVTTPIGSPKLEMIADKIVETANRLGVSPETARDMVMTGEARMGKAHGGIIRKADGGMVDSVPEEAIKNTVRDPQAARLLDLDLAKYALMNQQPQRMAGGGAMKKIAKAATKPAALSQAEKDANLKQWMSSGKIRTDEGDPLRLYHATPKDFDQFKAGGDDPTMSGVATWLTDNPEYQPAAHNIGGGQRGFKEGTNVMPVYSNASRPLLIDDPQMQQWANDVFAGGKGELPYMVSPNTAKAIKEAGYDYIHYADPHKSNEPHEYIMLDPERQIKSAIGNRGTYDPNEPSITKAHGGAVRMAQGGQVLSEAIGGQVATPIQGDMGKMSFDQYRKSIGMHEGGRHMAQGGQVQRFDEGGQASLDQMRYELANSPVMQATPRSPMQDFIGTAGGYMDRAGKFVSEAIEPIAEKHPVKTFLANMFLADPLKSAGTLMQDLTGTVRETDEDNPVRGVISKNFRNLTNSTEPLLDPRVLDLAGFASPVVKGVTKLAGAGVKAVEPFATRVDDMVRELHASGAIPQPGMSIKDVTPKVLAPANEQGFYSPTEAAALNLQRKTGNGQAFLNDIMKGENVKSDEISAMGLDTFLKDKKNVTAAEVQDYIAQNKVQLGEARYGKTTANNSDYAQVVKDGDEYYIKVDGETDWERPFSNENSAQAKVAEILDHFGYGKSEDTSKFKQYSLPGGENYREVVITIPVMPNQNAKIEQTKFGRWRVTYANGDDAVFHTEKEARDAKGGASTYRSSHWDEPNPLAHLRMSDRVTDGKKTLLVDEVQSDWHQAGREQGYKTEESAVAKKAYRDYGNDLKTRYADYLRNDLSQEYKNPQNLETQVKQMSEGLSLGQMARHFNEQDKYQQLYKDYNLEIGKNRQGVPNAPYKEDWYQLALRRAVKEAIDGGYDRVALPTGARVAERFDLSKQVDRIVVAKLKDGTFAWNAQKDGRIIQDQVAKNANDLSLAVGKDLARKAEAQTDIGANSIYEGDDLRVGGEGMKKYYDEIYPNYLKKFGKKYGASVGKTDVDADGVAEPLHYMDITPAMRKEFSTGIHMAKGGKVSFAKSADDMRKELLRNKHG